MGRKNSLTPKEKQEAIAKWLKTPGGIAAIDNSQREASETMERFKKGATVPREMLDIPFDI